CLAELAREREHLGELGLAAMEGGVEAGDLRDVRRPFRDRGDGGEIVGLVEGCQRAQRFQFAGDPGVDPDRLGKARAAMDDAVAGSRPSGRKRATAEAARRVSTAAARLVGMIGTRAPSTTPAASAPGRKEGLLASMFPASRSGTRRTLARPATGESIFLIAAA